MHQVIGELGYQYREILDLEPDLVIAYGLRHDASSKVVKFGGIMKSLHNIWGIKPCPIDPVILADVKQIYNESTLKH